MKFCMDWVPPIFFISSCWSNKSSSSGFEALFLGFDFVTNITCINTFTFFVCVHAHMHVKDKVIEMRDWQLIKHGKMSTKLLQSILTIIPCPFSHNLLL